jgi:hypothetical protein
MAEILAFSPNEAGENYQVDCDAVLEGPKGTLTEVIVIGLDHEGSLYVASSHGKRDMLWLMEHAKLMIMSCNCE